MNEKSSISTVTEAIRMRSGFVARALFICAAAVILLAGIKQIGDIISVVILAILITVLALPLLNYFDRKQWPLALSLLIIFLVMVVAVIGISMIIPPAVQAIYQSLNTVSVFATKWMVYAEQYLINRDWVDADFSLKALIDFQRLVGWSSSLLNVAVGLLSDFFLVITLALFMLYEAHSIPARIDGLYDKHPSFHGAGMTLINQLRHYMLIKLATSTLTALLLLPILWIFLPGDPWPWVFLALIMNFLPIFGSILAAVPPVLLTLITGDWISASIILLNYLGVNVLVGNVLEPRLMGKGLGLSALVVLISLSFWGWILGIVGLFMAVPLTLAIKLLLEMDEDLRWIALLLSESGNNTSPPSRSAGNNTPSPSSRSAESDPSPSPSD